MLACSSPCRSEKRTAPLNLCDARAAVAVVAWKPVLRKCPASRSWRRATVLSIGLLVVTLLGCGQPPEVSPAARSAPVPSTATAPDLPVMEDQIPAASPPVSADATPSPSPIALRSMTWDEVQSLVKEQRGKIVVIDFWSTSCVPCLRELPHLVALQGRYPQDVVCVGLNCDYIGLKKRPPNYYTEKVIKALTDIKAERLENILCTLPADDLFAAVKLDSIPAVFVYNRAGELAHRFDNRTSAAAEIEGVSYEKQITPAVTALVDQQ